jgi:hypothetical protein
MTCEREERPWAKCASLLCRLAAFLSAGQQVTLILLLRHHGHFAVMAKTHSFVLADIDASLCEVDRVVERVGPWRMVVYEYARGRLWNQFAGMSWGDDGDCSAVLLAYGPSGGRTSSWDFAPVVKYCTDGRHPNHGLILYGVPNVDYPNIFARECEVIKNRPCLAVIYEPKFR